MLAVITISIFVFVFNRMVNARNASEGSTRFHALYSTPSCYLEALNEEKNVAWPTRSDDMFPLWANPVFYFNGYSSRPSLKYLIRKASSILQVCYFKVIF